MSQWSRIMAGVTAFRKAYLASDASHEATFESVGARQSRYSLYWAFFTNSAYDSVHNWATALKHQYSLGKYIRNLGNPAYRLGLFYQTHLWGGALDVGAGPEGACPIKTDNEALRPAIAALWKASQWATHKDIVALRGAIEGDTLLRVVDDPIREKVYLERVVPALVDSLTVDAFGNIKGYTLIETRPDPSGRSRTVVYKEVVSRDGDLVVYETFLNGQPHGWGEQPATWQEPYGFVPMVLIQHLNVGLEFGMSALHSGRSKIMEVDDLMTMISDQIRKTVNPVYLMKGMKRGTLTTTGASATTTGATDTRPHPGREELKAIWNAPSDAKAEALLAPLNLQHALAHVGNILQQLENDYPELRVDAHASSGTSGRALRIARQQTGVLVKARRQGYDAALVKAQAMAVAIGGWRSYKGYEGFGLDSYAQGALEHTIADRPVFESDPLDIEEVEAAFWSAAKIAVDSGANLAGYLKARGWTEEQIEEMTNERPSNI